MKRRALAHVLIVLAILSAVFNAYAEDAGTGRIFDGADLLSEAEELSLAGKIAVCRHRTGMDFVVVTSDEPHEGRTTGQIADAFYDLGGFGTGPDHSGALYYIDLHKRSHYISTTGKMIDVMTDQRLGEALDLCVESLAKGYYRLAMVKMMESVQAYVREGVPEGQYRYDAETGESLQP